MTQRNSVRALVALGGLLLTACGPSDTRDSVEAGPGDAGPEVPTLMTCDNYPEHFDFISSGEVIPPMAWETMFYEGGQSAGFSLMDFFCNPRWDEYSSMLLLVGAGWCGACPPHFEEVSRMSDRLRSKGMYVGYLMTQSQGGSLAMADEAQEWIEEAIEDSPGPRLGDGENSTPGAISLIANPVPTTLFINRRTMRVIDENQAGGRLPYEEMADDPDRDWLTSLGAGVESSCAEGEDESSEPNNTISTAHPIEEGMHMGAICNPGPDYYRVSIEGSYQVDFDYESEGTLELNIFNERGERVAYWTPTSGAVIYAGPSYIVVTGDGGATGTYTLDFDIW